MNTLQTNSSRSAWQVKSMERRKRASFCTTDIQRSWDSVKGRGSTSGVSLAVVDSVSIVERGHSAVRRRRIRSLKCWKRKPGQVWNYDISLKCIHYRRSNTFCMPHLQCTYHFNKILFSIKMSSILQNHHHQHLNIQWKKKIFTMAKERK